jgi:putative ABC transport system permease protein
MMLKYGRLEGYAGIVGVDIDDLGEIGLRASQGELTLEKGTAVIGSWVSRNFYDPKLRPGQEPPPPPDLFGQDLKLILIKWSPEGIEVRKTIPLKIAGILSETKGEPDGLIYVSMDDLTAWNEWSLGRRINRNREGYNMLIVQAADLDQVLDIAEQIKNMGYMANTPQEFVQGINSFYMVLQIAFGAVGAISLLVAAIGIANTMAMAILERTREIGLMKAVGATNRDVLSIFLGEAAGIGFIGGAGGILLGWSLGQIINVVAMAYLAGQAVQTGSPPPTMAVHTPLWLPISSLLFSTFVGLISGLYPALRAATLVPVNALKYE